MAGLAFMLGYGAAIRRRVFTKVTNPMNILLSLYFFFLSILPIQRHTRIDQTFIVEFIRKIMRTTAVPTVNIRNQLQ